MGEYLNLQKSKSSNFLSLSLVLRVDVSSKVANGVAPYQALCLLALTLKERASELIRN